MDGPEGATLTVDLDPGRHVVTLFVAVPQGDVSYGLLLEVEPSSPAPAPNGLAIGETATLAPGRPVAISGEGATLRFVAVTQDSRCPSDAVCLWAGEARLAFALDAAGATTVRGVAAAPGGAASVALGPYLLTVLDLSPEATTAGAIPQSEYRATIVLERLPALPAASGVQGFVSVGPLCPVLRSDQPCPDLPLEATLVLEDASGNEVARASSGADGLYRIAAPAGSYTLVPQRIEGRPLPFAGPLAVTIGVDGWTTLDVGYDSGIR